MPRPFYADYSPPSVSLTKSLFQNLVVACPAVGACRRTPPVRGRFAGRKSWLRLTRQGFETRS